MISEAPGHNHEMLTMDQLEKFFQSFIEQKYLWKRFRILGGEPTLHKDFREIIGYVVDYRNLHNPKLKIEVSTHGNGKHTQKQLLWLKDKYPFIKHNNSHKKTNHPSYFNYMNLAPMDRNERMKNHNYRGCWIVRDCGIGFDYSGFYVCSAGAAISRIFGYKIGIKDFKEFSEEKMIGMYNLLCSKCGHYQPVRVNPHKPETLMSKTWSQAFESFRKNPELLTRF
jgi:hypothetical protein